MAKQTLNRIILIGNGFDLAHGLKTRYHDFIIDFWSRQAKEIKDSDDWKKQEQEENQKEEIRNKWTKTVFFENDHFRLKFEKNLSWNDLRNKVEYKNKFLEEINNTQNIENWLDIEKLYFKELKKCKNEFKKYEFTNPEKAIEPVKKLNSDFEVIKKELENYLKEEIIKKKLVINNSINPGYEKKLQTEFKRIIFEGKCKEETELCEKILLLNFNYTNTEELYKTYSKGNKDYKFEENNKGSLKIIHIHGKLDEIKNKMIFGYGDEKSDESKEIENLDDNRFLENVKSVRYTETNNYGELEDFIKEPYKVVVLGHSCGNSDRTLLKMLFEGEKDKCKCEEIIVYYYFDPKNLSDNFNDIRNNIYRNFDDKGIFRTRLRNKQHSDRIPNKDLLEDKTVLDLFVEENLINIKVPNVDFNYKLLDERVTSEFILNNYYIGKYQVTQSLWESVMGNNPSNFIGKFLPVENVSWFDAVEFCNKLTEKLNIELEEKDKKTFYYNIVKDKNGIITKVDQIQNATGFRLPTEAEWEYAARGGNKSKNYEYSGSNHVKDVAWYNENSDNMTHPVGQLKPNELGLYDMSGNVWEWCEDKYSNDSSNRVLRGGSCSDYAQYCRVSYRNYFTPDFRSYFMGFRLVLVP